MHCEPQPVCNLNEDAKSLRCVLDLVPALVSYIDCDGIYRLNGALLVVLSVGSLLNFGGHKDVA